MKLLISETASFDVDAQSGFTIIAGGLVVKDGEKIVPFLNKQSSFSRLRVASKDWHNRNAKWLSSALFPQYSVIDGNHSNMDVYWDEHCIGGEAGADFLPGLPDKSEYDFIVYKGLEVDMHPYGACYHDIANKKSTGVIEYLKCNGIKNVIVGGLAHEYCVKVTALQLKQAGFNVILSCESTKGLTPEGISSANLEMDDAGIELVYQLSTLSEMFI